MLNMMPRNRTQMWLSRGAIAVLIILLVLLKTVGLADVTSVTRGNMTVYSAPPFVSILSGIIGIVVCVAAVVYWMQRGIFCRGVSVALFVISTWVLFNAPTGINHRVVVTPEYFFHRVGSWYSPVETRVDFKSLVYVSIGEAKRASKDRKSYELRCTKDGGADTIRIPVYDLMKKALPEILKRAAEHDVVIGEGSDGRVIPSGI